MDRAHLADGYAQAILVNSGNANTCAANGVELAEACCQLTGQALGIPAGDVLPASTGVIGQPMTIDPFAAGIPAAAAKLAHTAQGSADAATAIMTTDTCQKEYAIRFQLGGKSCTLGAIGKGSGMIAPNMATMLAFYTTDAAVSPAMLQKALRQVVPGTYNQMSVDLDTSTNDTLLIMASGLAGNPCIQSEGPDYDAFVEALTAIAEHMCALHAGDGEGATHLITCQVTGAPDLKTAPGGVPQRGVLQPVQGGPCSAGTPTGAASSAPSAIRRGISPSIRCASGCPAPPARCMSARMQPTTLTARKRPPGCWQSATSWCGWTWAWGTPPPRHGAAT